LSGIGLWPQFSESAYTGGGSTDILELKESFVKTSVFLTLILATSFAAAAHSQAVPATKETGKAVAESTKEAGDNIKAATAKQPNKAIDKAKAHVHKAKAHAHSHAAKADAKAAVK
jgi:hypothetical protein